MRQFHFEGHSLLGFKISEICTIGQIHSQSTSQSTFEGQGHIVGLWTYPKVYVESFRSLAVLLHTERENLLNTPSIMYITVQWALVSMCM